LCGEIAPWAVHLWDIDPLARPRAVAFAGVHPGHAIEATEGVQAAVVGDHAHSAAPVVHGGDKSPLGRRRVEVFSRVQALLAVEAPTYKDLSWAINTGNCGGRGVAPLVMHGSDHAPLVGLLGEALHRVLADMAVKAAHGVDESLEQGHAHVT
ncbi:hypothetical protein EGW08_000366, partial [Elysia chlorotica]